MAARFVPIDLDRHADICVRFRRDSFVCSFGSDAEFERTGGAAPYLEWLRARAAELPEGIVHVWSEQHIVGQVEMRMRGAPREAYVNLFYLAPSVRGSGLGNDLHDYAIAVLRAHSIAIAKLSVSSSNARALRYYAKHGWNDIGVRPDRSDLREMQLSLDATDAG